MIKLKSHISIYKINKCLFVRNKDQIFEISETKNKEIFPEYIQALEKGIEKENFKNNLPKGDQEDFIMFCDLLGKHDLLETGTVQIITPKNNRGDNILVGKNTTITIISGSRDSRTVLEKILRENGYNKIKRENEKTPKTDSFMIFIKDNDTSEQEIEKINKENIKKRVPWLLVDMSIDGYGAIGPLILPGITACYQCFTKRKTINNDALTAHDLEKKQFIKQGNVELPPWNLSLVFSIVIHFLRLPLSFSNSMLYIDFNSLETWKEGLLKYPKCQVCNKNEN